MSIAKPCQVFVRKSDVVPGFKGDDLCNQKMIDGVLSFTAEESEIFPTKLAAKSAIRFTTSYLREWLEPAPKLKQFGAKKYRRFTKPDRSLWQESDYIIKDVTA